MERFCHRPNGQGDGEGRTLVLALAGGTDGSTVEFGNMTDDGETETETTVPPRP